MTKVQEQILELISQLTPDERRDLLTRIQEGLGGRHYDRLSEAERAHIEKGIAEADRGLGEPASVVFERLSRKLDVAKL